MTTTPPIPAEPTYGKDRPPTLAEYGLSEGSAFVATPEEAVELQRAEDERHARANAQVDAMLAATTTCRVCHTPNTTFRVPDRVCADCRPVLVKRRAERLEDEQVNGRARRELVDAYLDSEATRT